METYLKPPRTGLEASELMPEGTFCQLINDSLIMSPAPTPFHQELAGLLFEKISGFVRTLKLGKVFFSPIDVYLSNKNVFQPDIVFVSSAKSKIIDWKKGIMEAPDLVIEILSKGNEKYDLSEKKLVYESSGVLEYWVVDPETKWCEGFYLENKIYKSLGGATGEIALKLLNLTITF